MTLRRRRKDVPRRGRPPTVEGRVRFSTTLPPGYGERLRAIGGGNASAAIVRLVDEHAERQRERA